jgi:hypothetical protein
MEKLDGQKPQPTMTMMKESQGGMGHQIKPFSERLLSGEIGIDRGDI